LLDSPDATPVLLGTVDGSAASGQGRVSFNKTGRRLHVKIIESSSLQGQKLRGWKVYYKVVGRKNAP
jgi:hypothetical protein